MYYLYIVCAKQKVMKDEKYLQKMMKVLVYEIVMGCMLRVNTTYVLLRVNSQYLYILC